MRLHFVGDGPRDKAMVPALVAKALNIDAAGHAFSVWARLNDGRGYARKLRFAMRQAVDARAAGLVAVVDADKSGRERLGKLKAGRETQRAESPAFPTALGCARPHVEAWLLDDPKAVREGLRLSSGHEIPSVTRVSPKAALDELGSRADAGRANEDEPDAIPEWLRQIPADIDGDGARSDRDKKLVWLWKIAVRVDAQRCTHADESGFADFLSELSSEIEPIATRGNAGPTTA